MEPTMLYRPDSVQGATESEQEPKYFYKVYTEKPGDGWHSSPKEALKITKKKGK